MKRQTLKAILSVVCMAVMAHECMAIASTAAPAQRLSHYSQVQLDTVDITVAGNGRWDGVTDTQRQQALALARESFARAAAGAGAQITATEGETLRLSLTLEDMKPANTTRSVINHVLPIGLVANVGKSVSGAGASRTMGSVTIAGELRDARSGTLVASFRAETSPDPMNLNAVISQDAAMKAAIERSAEAFATALSKVRKGEDPCAGSSTCRLTLQPVAAG
ncbi:DUF3313 family protein [Niveibacterium sp. COAC-50]|uniref:DUF3313 family protein n=1 Tax=Niveibacterium sp. COAC-50 TaxID=2729384 RepID=UPI0015579F30|nr:DUF3313 family protein [Niveibacterium sp. COAC-50]